ncbi:MAG: amino acid ABC transporter permease, partial [Lachnospiraceae bacterium]|nr:amino acid ABC transporter permease [Lachnospiraceae bacterium]
IFAIWRWEYLWADRMLFLKAFVITLELSIGGLILALLIGFTVGIASTFASKLVRAIARIYVELFRNIPLTLQIMFFYYGCVYGGIKISTMTVGIVGLGVCSGAYIAEIVRSGLNSIPKGQYEAAASQGLNYFQTMQHVILPQTIRVILPPLGTQMAWLILDTSVLSIIAGGDLLYVTKNWSSNGTLSYGPAYLVCGLIFFLMCYPLTSTARKYEKKMKAGREETI